MRWTGYSHRQQRGDWWQSVASTYKRAAACMMVINLPELESLLIEEACTQAFFEQPGGHHKYFFSLKRTKWIHVMAGGGGWLLLQRPQTLSAPSAGAALGESDHNYSHRKNRVWANWPVKSVPWWWLLIARWQQSVNNDCRVTRLMKSFPSFTVCTTFTSFSRSCKKVVWSWRMDFTTEKMPFNSSGVTMPFFRASIGSI